MQPEPHRISPVRLRDSDIRAIVRSVIIPPLAKNSPSKVVEEMQVCCGEARIDLAVINGKLHGFEIKSDADTLERLPRQVEAYNRVFDTLNIIVGSTHLSRISDLIPSWWGIYVVSGQPKKVEITQFRIGSGNPDIDPVSLAQLLWKSELLSILESLGKSKGMKSKACFFLWKALAELCPLDILQDRVRTILRARSDWRPAALQT